MNNDIKNNTIIYTRGFEKNDMSNPPPPTPYLFIKQFISKKTNKIYYGTILNNVFYFVHIDDGVKLIEKTERISGNKYYLYKGKYDIVNTERSKDIFIRDNTELDEILKKNKELLTEIKIDE